MAMGGVTFGKLIRERRRQVNLTQAEVAQRIGTSTPYIGHLESDKRCPSESVVARIADALGFDRKDLFLLANPKAKAILGATEDPPAESTWEEFRRNQQLQRSMHITSDEMEMLSRVALMGQVRSSRDFVFILNTVRQALAA